MNTKLIFFGKLEDSIKGTTRGMIALIVLIILSSLWYKVLAKSFYKKYYILSNKNLIGYCLVIFILISAVGVQLASSMKEASVYGALVGFALYGFLNGTNLIVNKKWDYKITFVDILWGIVCTSIMSIIVYIFSN
jgi:uncharacterized membrane protein